MVTDADTQHRHNINNKKDIGHVEMKIDSNPNCDLLFRLGVTLTSNKLGQYVVRKLDRMLWIIENTAKWSVSQNISDSENAVPPPPLIQPLNWFLFIPALIVMRLFRAGASQVLLLLGYEALAPITIVHAVQKQRRVLRSVRYQGLKILRVRNAVNTQDAKNGKFSVLLSILCGLICSRPNFEESVKIVVKSNNQSKGRRLLRDENKCNKEGDVDLNSNCADLLYKYGSMSDEESEPEGRIVENELDEEKHKTENEPIKESNEFKISEPVEVVQNNKGTKEHSHSVIHENGDSIQSKLPEKYFQNEQHNFNHKLHYDDNSHEPSNQNHTLPFNLTGFLAHQMNRDSNNRTYDHVPPPPPSSLSSTSSTSSSATNVSSGHEGSNTAAGNNNPRKITQTKYNKSQRNRQYGGGGNKQNTKQNTY